MGELRQAAGNESRLARPEREE